MCTQFWALQSEALSGIWFFMKFPGFQLRPLLRITNRTLYSGLQTEKLLPLFHWLSNAFDCVDHKKLWKALRRWEYQTISPVSSETRMWVKKQQLEPCIEQLTGSGLRKAYDRVVCCHPVNLTYMLSTLREMLVWMSFKWESKTGGKNNKNLTYGWYMKS